MAKGRGRKRQPLKLRESMEKHVGGRFAMMLGDAHGHPLWDAPQMADNVAVTSGRSWLLRHIMSAQSSAVSSQIIQAIGIGTSTTAPATGDTLLGAELSRVSYTTETDNTGASPPNVIWAASWATNLGNGTLAEAGIFNTTTANAQTMLAHVTFTATFAKSTSNSLTVSYFFTA